MTVDPLSSENLYRQCDPAQFTFATTADLEASIKIIGQERAVAAVRFGVGMQQPGYNLFALGPNGVGKYTAVCRYLEEKATGEETPPDWCYIHNFEQEHQPKVLQLPAGKGITFCQDMERLLDELFTVIPAAFESEEYQTQRQTISDRLQEKQEEALETINEEAKEEDIALIRTQSGLAFAPIREGDVVAPEEFMQLPPEEREAIQEKVDKLQDKLQKMMRQVPQWSRQSREELKELDRENATFAIAPLFEELEEKYADFPEVLSYLEAMKADVTDNADKFLKTEAQSPAASSQAPQAAADGRVRAQPPGRRVMRSSPFFNRYEVNLIVDNSQTEGAPVIYADHPTYQNLNGRIEQMAQMGALFTDFTLIKPGALHRANGGYLILDARKVLLQPYTWESLKRALQADEINIEPLGQSLGLISTVSLEPEPIPLDVKVVLLGERRLYYLLYQLDPDFGELFKVAADFENEMERSPENNEIYAQLIGSLAQKDDLNHFGREAVARVIEFSSRLAGDAERLSTHMQSVADLLREASYWATEGGSDVVEASHVQEAIDAQRYRNGRIRDRMQESILRETILIDTDGAAVGQINGLSVLSIGKQMFGRPNRITARVRLGKGEVVDIERKVEMGGPIHSKGVLILAGFLGGRYADERPLSLSASLVFEQSYGGVDGDSASSAELYALLSALAEAPIRQDLAVTGSVNQRGQVQAIGGVNEKIEGFFDICRQRDLTGSQGVLIPAANVKNLMLRQDVRAAVQEGSFHIYPIQHIDQGIEILTGVSAGAPDEEGNYPPESINRRVVQRLTLFAEKRRAFQNSENETNTS